MVAVDGRLFFYWVRATPATNCPYCGPDCQISGRELPTLRQRHANAASRRTGDKCRRPRAIWVHPGAGLPVLIPRAGRRFVAKVSAKSKLDVRGDSLCVAYRATQVRTALAAARRRFAISLGSLAGMRTNSPSTFRSAKKPAGSFHGNAEKADGTVVESPTLSFPKSRDLSNLAPGLARVGLALFRSPRASLLRNPSGLRQIDSHKKINS